MLNIMLDDDLIYRQTPNNFKRFVTGNDLIDFINNHPTNLQINILTLDNDLGDGHPEGYQVLDFILEQIVDGTPITIAQLNIHSKNTVASDRMVKAVTSAMTHHILPKTTLLTKLPLSTL